MSTQKYRLVFSGELVSGVSQSKARDNLVRLLKISPQKANRYFSGDRIVLKNNIDIDAAQKIRSVFNKCGLICNIEEVDPLPVVREASEVVDGEVVETVNIQTIVMSLVASVIRLVWSCTIGFFFLFPLGAILFVLIDILMPRSSKSYEVLTNMYKWGSCHWFKKIKLEVQQFDLEVQKKHK